MAFNPSNARAYIHSEDYAVLADVGFIVEGSQLPAHSQVLAQHSTVLRGLFLEQEPSRQQPVRLEAPFKDFSTDVVASCLWFMYHPDTLAGTDFGSIGDKLPALLRLTNQLDFTALQNAILQNLQASILPGASLDTALQLASVLEALHLSKPWAACVLRLARLVSVSDHMANLAGFQAFQLKDRLSSTTTAALMGAASARLATGGFPSVDGLACWLEGREPPKSHLFSWRVTGYSRHEGMVESEPFTALERSWRLKLFPRGNGREDFLSLYLKAEGLTEGQQVPAYIKFHLINVGDQGANITKIAPHNFCTYEEDWGYTSFAPLASIRDPEAGFLVNDCLTLAVDIWKMSEPKAETSDEELEEA